MTSNQKWTALLRGTPIFLLASFVIFIGCNSGSGTPLSDVTGVVTMDGNPATGAALRFTPKSGQRASSGRVGQDGKYRLIFTPDELGAVIGEHEVFVQYKGKMLTKNVAVEDSGTSTLDLELSEFKEKGSGN